MLRDSLAVDLGRRPGLPMTLLAQQLGYRSVRAVRTYLIRLWNHQSTAEARPDNRLTERETALHRLCIIEHMLKDRQDRWIQPADYLQRIIDVATGRVSLT